MTDLLPCPFCGATSVSVREGSTFRWRYASCDECGAQAGEVRRQTLGEGTKEEWEAEATRSALAEWNRRKP
jgi:Lar family restriction alleviation protein